MIHVVVGHTGEYSDYTTWVVTAYDRAPDADRHATALNKWCRENGYTGHRSGRAWDIDCPLDPGFSCDYTGTHYSRESVPSPGRFQAAIRKVMES